MITQLEDTLSKIIIYNRHQNNIWSWCSLWKLSDPRG